MLALILDGRTAIDGARQGIELCLRTVIPSLFPFFVLSILLISSLLGSSLAGSAAFGAAVRNAGWGGIPADSGVSGRVSRGGAERRRRIPQRQLTKPEAERLLSFCSNAGPAFLFGMAAAMFPRRWMAWALWGIHIVGALFAALLIPGKPAAPVRLTKTSPHSPASVLNTAITVMATVCGWVVLFRVLLAFLKRWIFWILPAAVQVAVTGILELSNGCCELLAVTDVSARFCICSGILAFGGLCVTMQTVSVTAGLSLKPYFWGKLLQTLFSLALAALIAYGIWLPFGVLSVGALVIKLQKRGSFSGVFGV